MTTWYIERIPAAGGATDIRTLAGWGIDAATITSACWGEGGATIALPSNTAGTTAPTWAHLDHLVVWAGNPSSGGARKYHLWVLLPGHHADPQAEAHTMSLVGPWWWLQQTQFFYPLTVDSITTDPETGAATGCTWHMRHGTTVVWTSWADQSSGTIKGQINRALYCAIDNNAPISIGAIDITGLAPVLEQQGCTCADVIARAARYSPRSSQWWDMSGETPVFRAASLANRPALSLALGPDSQAWDIAPRPDLRIDVVRVGYQWDNDGATAAWYDIAGDDELKDGVHTLRSLVNCPSSAIASNAASHYGIASQLYTALHSTPYTGSAAWWGDATNALIVHPGHALRLAGGLTAWATMDAPITSVALTISSAVDDSVQVSLGLPDSLGANDLFELYNIGINLGSGAVGSSGGTAEPASGNTPGTLDDLNGTSFPGSPGGSIAVQSRGGTWQKKGFASPDTSVTLRRWLSRTWSGTLCISGSGYSSQIFPVSNCTEPRISARKWVFAGADTYNPANDTVSAASTLGVYNGDDQGGTCSTVALSYTATPTALPNDTGSIGSGATQAITTTSRAQTGIGCIGGGTVNSWWDTCTGEARFDLSNEDTEDNAFARVTAAAEWTSSPTTAIRTIPTTGLTGIRRSIRYRTEHTSGGVTTATLTGLAIWQRYRIALHMQRRPVDETGAPTGDWEDAETLYSPAFISNISGEGGIDWQEIEPEAGYETKIITSEAEQF